jgi:hypothetical protein
VSIPELIVITVTRQCRATPTVLYLSIDEAGKKMTDQVEARN